MSLEFSNVDHINTFSSTVQQEDFLSALHALEDVDSFTQFALDAVLGAVNAHAGSLFLWDEAAKELVQQASRNSDGNRVRGVRMRLKEGVAGWVADLGQPVLVKDIQHDERFNEIKRPGEYQSPSFICLPLVSNNKLLGIVNLTEKEDRAPFTEREWEQAERLARHISVAYENLKIRTRLEQENHSLLEQIADLRQTLKLQEQLVSIGKLASHLAHELSNPLDAIRRFVNLALDEVMEDSLAREYLLKAKKGIRRSIRVIRGLLAFSRESYQSQERKSDLNAVINQSVETAMSDPRFGGVVIERRLAENPIVVRDCGLQVVCKNLVENAMQAIKDPQGSRPGIIRIETRIDGTHAWIFVEDNGCGIPESIQPKLFEPFFTTKTQQDGNGIGLAICRDIIERSGGQISFESREGKGAKFMISLPCEETA